VRLATRNFVRLFLVLLQYCCRSRLHFLETKQTTKRYDTKEYFFPPGCPYQLLASGRRDLDLDLSVKSFLTD